MQITGTIHDMPTVIPTLNSSCLPFLTAMNQAWWNNAMQLGWLCLVVGFLIGAVSVYLYYRRRENEWDRTYGNV